MLPLLCLPLLLSPAAPDAAGVGAAPTSTNGEKEEAAGSRIWIVHHAGDARLRDALVRQGDVWHDAGLFLVGALDERTIRGLRARDIDVLEVGAVDMREELWIISDDEVDRLGGKLSPFCRDVVRTGGLRLLALPAGMVPHAAGAPATTPRHVGASRVARRAWRPLPPAHWDGARGPGTELGAGVHDARVQALVDQVDRNNLLARTTDLSAIFSRKANQPGAFQARDMIEAWFQSFGLATRLEGGFGIQYSQNVIAEIPGTRHPDEIVVIGAHYDSVNHAGADLAAPGADDNASGTSGVVEMARVLAAGGPYERTIRFIAFGAEEVFLLGSAESAQNSSARGENIVAMLNNDMNAYRAPGDTLDVDLILNATDGKLNDYYEAMGALYVPGWAVRRSALSGGTSDHRSYFAEGFPAVFPFEDLDSTPYIHTANDTVALSAIDWDLAELVVKSCLATAVSRVELVDMTIAHSPLPDTSDSRGPYRVSAAVTNLNDATVIAVELFYSDDGGLRYTSLPMADAGGGVWEADIPPLGSPVDIAYYLVASDDQGATETSPEGFESGGLPHAFLAGTRDTLYETSFEILGDEGWTWGGTPAREGWQRGICRGKAGDAGYAYDGRLHWGNDMGWGNLDGKYEPNGNAWLKSPPIDGSAAQNVHLEFRRWLTVEDAAADQARVLVNGTLVWENPTGQDLVDTTWTSVDLDVTALAAGNPSVTIQFELQADGVFEHGGWNIDAFRVTEKGPVSGVVVFGGGVNPPGSMVALSGTASLGGTVVLGLDNPLGTQGAGASTFLALSLAPDAAHPAGTLVPGWGMAGAGADGELLIGVAAPDPFQTLVGPPWGGAGNPAAIAIMIPNDPSLVGVSAYGQGLLLDPVAAGGVKFGLTEGVILQIAP